jgi:hypothetical protein
LELHCTVWTVDFETPVANLFIVYNCRFCPRKRKKREEIAAAHWCFKACNPISNLTIGTALKTGLDACITVLTHQN